MFGESFHSILVILSHHLSDRSFNPENKKQTIFNDHGAIDEIVDKPYTYCIKLMAWINTNNKIS